MPHKYHIIKKKNFVILIKATVTNYGFIFWTKATVVNYNFIFKLKL